MNDQTILLQDGAAILASIGILPANVPPLTRNAFIDRELILSVSDGFARQTWVRDGRVSHETREALAIDADEHVRITIANDMPGVRVITIGDGRMLRLSAGQSGSIDVTARHGGDFAITVIGQPSLARPVKVQRGANARVKAA